MAKAKELRHLWSHPGPQGRWTVKKQKQGCRSKDWASRSRKQTNRKPHTHKKEFGNFPPIFKSMRSNAVNKTSRLVSKWTVLSGSTAGLGVQAEMACMLPLRLQSYGKDPRVRISPQLTFLQAPWKHQRRAARLLCFMHCASQKPHREKNNHLIK